MESFTVRSTDIDRCAVRSLVASHYRPGGTCKCTPLVSCARKGTREPEKAFIAVDGGMLVEGWHR